MKLSVCVMGQRRLGRVAYVDQKVCTAAALEEHSERWQEDGQDDLDDVAADFVSDYSAVS